MLSSEQILTPIFMEKVSRNSIVLASLASLIFGTIGGGFTSWAVLTYATPPSTETPGETVINFEGGSYKEVYDEASPAVVSVVAMKDLSEYYQQMSPFAPFMMPGQTPQENTPESGDGELSKVSSGTGFILSADGLVMTNKHVVEDTSAQYVVILDDGTELDAEVLARDTLNDIALIQIKGDDERIGKLPTLSFGDSDALSVGDPVLAIGNALGEYSNTTTAGIVSSTDRQIVASGAGFGSENLVNLIQTDAAINPGNSGGPLLNLAGEVIGMNTAIDSTANGIGFAIPSNDLSGIVDSYKKNGRIVRPFVGVRYVPVTAQLQQRFSLDVDHGAYVIGDPQSGPGVVADGPAAKAGIEEGDVILSLNGEDISSEYNLQNAIASYAPGDVVKLEVWKDGKTRTVELTLGEQAAETSNE